MSEWKPIETAPKDGTRVLIVSDDQVFIGYWSESAKFGDEIEKPGWQIHESEMDEWYAVAVDDATHWTPIPEPPVTP